MTPGQQEVAATVAERLAEVGPRFVDAHEAVVEANKRRKAIREELVVLVREGQAVNANMSELARAAGVTRQALYVWLKD